ALVLTCYVATPPSRQLLVPDGTAGDGPERLPAGTAGAVPRPQLQVVGKRHEPLAEAREELSSALEARVDVAGRFIEQVGPPDVADEHPVARQKVTGLVGELGVGDEERQVLGCVARGVHHGEPDATDVDDVTVLERLMFEPVLPFGSTLIGEG